MAYNEDILRWLTARQQQQYLGPEQWQQRVQDAQMRADARNTTGRPLWGDESSEIGSLRSAVASGQIGWPQAQQYGWNANQFNRWTPGAQVAEPPRAPFQVMGRNRTAADVFENASPWARIRLSQRYPGQFGQGMFSGNTPNMQPQSSQAMWPMQGMFTQRAL